jgi:hypothetical protein
VELSYGNVDINVGAIYQKKHQCWGYLHFKTDRTVYLNLYFHLCVPLHIQITSDLLI